MTKTPRQLFEARRDACAEKLGHTPYFNHWNYDNTIAGYTNGFSDPQVLELVRAAKALVGYYERWESKSSESVEFTAAIKAYEQATGDE